MSEFGSLWARRRAAVKAEEAQEALAAERAVEQARATEIDALTDEEALTQLGLPNPEEMGAGDDFTQFMRSDVPERFRKVALRQLWRSNPVLANVDGLNEYDDDYRAQALGQVVKTAYQVGKGMMAHVEEMQRQKEAKEAADTDSVDEACEEDTPKVAVDAETQTVEPLEEDRTASDAPQDHEEIEMAANVRRMRFRFEETV
ncbi:MAG: DUF3306 domain-containing protein [Roseobacter sp.]